MLRGTLLAVLFTATSAGALELYFGPSTHPSGLGENVSVDCTPDPSAYENDWIGYSTSGPARNSGITSCADPHDYLWTLSASSTDPFVNSGPAVSKLYVWFVCTNQDGLSAAVFDLVGDLFIAGCVPMNDVLFVANAPQLLFAVPGAPQGSLIVAELTIGSPAVSVESSTWGGIKSLYR